RISLCSTPPLWMPALIWMLSGSAREQGSDIAVFAGIRSAQGGMGERVVLSLLPRLRGEWEPRGGAAPCGGGEGRRGGRRHGDEATHSRYSQRMREGVARFAQATSLDSTCGGICCRNPRKHYSPWCAPTSVVAPQRSRRADWHQSDRCAGSTAGK